MTLCQLVCVRIRYTGRVIFVKIKNFQNTTPPLTTWTASTLYHLFYGDRKGALCFERRLRSRGKFCRVIKSKIFIFIYSKHIDLIGTNHYYKFVLTVINGVLALSGFLFLMLLPSSVCNSTWKWRKEYTEKQVSTRPRIQDVETMDKQIKLILSCLVLIWYEEKVINYIIVMKYWKK